MTAHPKPAWSTPYPITIALQNAKGFPGLPDLVSEFKPEEIFNCDKTGLFYRALPDKTLERKKQDVKGGKLSKEKLTVLLACSSEEEKLKPLVIALYSPTRLWLL